MSAPGLRQRTIHSPPAEQGEHPVQPEPLPESTSPTRDEQHEPTAAGSDTDATHPAQDSPDPHSEEKQCRICFAGTDEEPELGRLFRPCRCKGSMKYVHVGCLNQWRRASPSRQNYFACPQCGYNYTLARTQAVSVFQSPIVRALTTFTLFTVIVFLSSFIANWLVPDPLAPPNPVDVDAGWSLGSYIGPSRVGESFRVAVRTLHDIGIVDLGEPDEDFGPVEKIVWKLTSSRRDMELERIKRRQTKWIRSLHPDKSEREKEPAPPPKSVSWIYSIIQRYVLGLLFVSVVSLFNLLLSLSIYAPTRLLRAAQGIGGGRRGRDRVNGGIDAATALILMALLLGLARALYKVYQLNSWLAQLLLARAETAILEVQEIPEQDGDRPSASIWPIRLYRRAIDVSRSSWRAAYGLFGDPFEPWFLKIGRFLGHSIMWVVWKVVAAWQQFAMVDVFG